MQTGNQETYINWEIWQSLATDIQFGRCQGCQALQTFSSQIKTRAIDNWYIVLILEMEPVPPHHNYWQINRKNNKYWNRKNHDYWKGYWKNYWKKNGITDACSTADCCPLMPEMLSQTCPRWWPRSPRWCPRHAPDIVPDIPHYPIYAQDDAPV